MLGIYLMSTLMIIMSFVVIYKTTIKYKMVQRNSEYYKQEVEFKQAKHDVLYYENKHYNTKKEKTFSKIEPKIDIWINDKTGDVYSYTRKERIMYLVLSAILIALAVILTTYTPV